jgi:hypothetical protein
LSSSFRSFASSAKARRAAARAHPAAEIDAPNEVTRLEPFVATAALVVEMEPPARGRSALRGRKFGGERQRAQSRQQEHRRHPPGLPLARRACAILPLCAAAWSSATPWASAAEAERSKTLLRNGIGGYCASGHIVVANG